MTLRCFQPHKSTVEWPMWSCTCQDQGVVKKLRDSRVKNQKTGYTAKVCIRIMLYQQILSRATPKCVEQLKCGEQKYIEDILNDRWQHHIQRQVLGIFAVYNFWSCAWILDCNICFWGSFLRPIQWWGQNWYIFHIFEI